MEQGRGNFSSGGGTRSGGWVVGWWERRGVCTSERRQDRLCLKEKSHGDNTGVEIARVIYFINLVDNFITNRSITLQYVRNLFSVLLSVVVFIKELRFNLV
jgi:hypothetical protein